MAIEELEEAGVLLPEDEWGKHRLKTTVRQGPFLVVALIAVASWIGAYAGGGGWLTWVSITVFLVTFFVVIWMCDRAVSRQRERVKEERP